MVTTDKRTWRNQFPADVAVPEEIQALVKSGMIADISWGNDAMPSFSFQGYEPDFVFRDSQPVKPNPYRLWVNYPEQERREVGGGEPRFSISLEHDADGYSDELLKTDSVHQIVRSIQSRFFAEYVATGGNACPWADCESSDTEAGNFNNEPDGRDTTIRCNDCGREWEEQFRMTRVAVVQGNRTCRVCDLTENLTQLACDEENWLCPDDFAIHMLGVENIAPCSACCDAQEAQS